MATDMCYEQREIYLKPQNDLNNSIHFSSEAANQSFDKLKHLGQNLNDSMNFSQISHISQSIKPIKKEKVSVPADSERSMALSPQDALFEDFLDSIFEYESNLEKKDWVQKVVQTQSWICNP